MYTYIYTYLHIYIYIYTYIYIYIYILYILGWLKKKNFNSKMHTRVFCSSHEKNFGENFYLFKIKFRGCSSMLKFVIVAGNQID